MECISTVTAISFQFSLYKFDQSPNFQTRMQLDLPITRLVDSCSWYRIWKLALRQTGPANHSLKI